MKNILPKFFRPNLIIDKRGFTVEIIGRNRLQYMENNRKLTLYVELLIGKFTFGISMNDIQSWDSPHNGELIDDLNKRRIVNNIKEVLDKKGFLVDIY